MVLFERICWIYEILGPLEDGLVAIVIMGMHEVNDQDNN